MTTISATLLPKLPASSKSLQLCLVILSLSCLVSVNKLHHLVHFKSFSHLNHWMSDWMSDFKSWSVQRRSLHLFAVSVTHASLYCVQTTSWCPLIHSLWPIPDIFRLHGFSPLAGEYRRGHFSFRYILRSIARTTNVCWTWVSGWEDRVANNTLRPITDILLYSAVTCMQCTTFLTYKHRTCTAMSGSRA